MQVGRLSFLSALTLALALSACGDDDTAGTTADTSIDTSADSGAAVPDSAADPADDTSDEDTAPDTAPETTPDTAGPVTLDVPPVLGPKPARDLDPAPGIVLVELRASQTHARIGDLTLALYGYNEVVPGPTIQAYLGDEVHIRFVNDLPEPTTVHWHGMRVPDWMDGNPRIQAPIEPGASFEYAFSPPEAGTFWYHPHIRSNEQVEKGLYGAFIVHERGPPDVDADRLVFLDDMLLDGDGFAPFLATMMEGMHGRLGNTLVTNGRADVLELNASAGQVERWRLVNPSNARTMSVSIEGASWRVVGTDGGLLPTPYETERLEIAVGQRYDLEVRYTGEGRATLTSHVLSLDANGQVVELGIPVVEVEVGPAAGEATVVRWPVAIPLPERTADEEVVLELDARNGAHGLEWLINGESHSDELLFSYPEGTTASLVIFNRAGPEHPFHLHGQFFEIVRRNGAPVTSEPGLKDTVLVPGLESVELRAYLDNPGLWMAHCHILEHAELGMMSQFAVSAP